MPYIFGWRRRMSFEHGRKSKCLGPRVEVHLVSPASPMRPVWWKWGVQEFIIPIAFICYLITYIYCLMPWEIEITFHLEYSGSLVVSASSIPAPKCLYRHII